MKREHSTKKIWFGCSSVSGRQSAPQRATEEHQHAISHRSNHSSQRRQQWRNPQPERRAAQEKCGAAEPQRFALPTAHHAARQPHATRSSSRPWIISSSSLKRARAKPSPPISAAMARFHYYSFREHLANRQTAARRPRTWPDSHLERAWTLCEEGREGHSDSRSGDRLPAQRSRSEAEQEPETKPAARADRFPHRVRFRRSADRRRRPSRIRAHASPAKWAATATG